MRRGVAPLVIGLALGCADESLRPSTDEFDDESGLLDDESRQDLPSGESGETSTDTGESSESETETDTSSNTTDEGDPQPYAPVLYSGGRVHSPITSYVADVLLAIREADPGLRDDVFMKVGASSTVNQNTLYCFALDVPELGAFEPELGPTLDYFLNGEAADTTPFDRVTLAAMVGKTASWAIAGDPSPLDQEFTAIDPSLALVHYGANDMQMGITYAAALPGFHAAMSDLLDRLIERGVVPVVFGLSRRLDQDGADDWVPTFDAVIRGLAQARQIPYLDLRLALEGLPGFGLSGDGLHLEAFEQGACMFTPEGLQHGYDVRNLIALELLDRLRAVLVTGETTLEPEPVATLAGAGDLDSPFVIPSLPFTDARDTSESSSRELDVYTGCASGADESGPEYVYWLEPSEPTSIRAVVLDREGVDVDIQLLDMSVSEAGCLARHDTLIQQTLAPGSYAIVIDTYVASGVEQAGAYTFVIHECEPGDPDCA
ncbi:SGNH/GDSL hydrolase family protein [Nannocystaceae bacterium ST9]